MWQLAGFTWESFEDLCFESANYDANPRYLTEKAAEANGVFNSDDMGGIGGNGLVDPPDAAFSRDEPSRRRQRVWDHGRVMLNNALKSARTTGRGLLEQLKRTMLNPMSPGFKPKPAPVLKPIR